MALAIRGLNLTSSPYTAPVVVRHARFVAEVVAADCASIWL